MVSIQGPCLLLSLKNVSQCFTKCNLLSAFLSCRHQVFFLGLPNSLSVGPAWFLLIMQQWIRAVEKQNNAENCFNFLLMLSSALDIFALFQRLRGAWKPLFYDTVSHKSVLSYAQLLFTVKERKCMNASPDGERSLNNPSWESKPMWNTYDWAKVCWDQNTVANVLFLCRKWGFQIRKKIQ